MNFTTEMLEAAGCRIERGYLPSNFDKVCDMNWKPFGSMRRGVFYLYKRNVSGLRFRVKAISERVK